MGLVGFGSIRLSVVEKYEFKTKEGKPVHKFNLRDDKGEYVCLTIWPDREEFHREGPSQADRLQQLSSLMVS